MAGLEHDPENDVTAIRRLLDQYSEGFAFVKELIQNANDGGSARGEGATKLLIKWHPGLDPLVRHPLLKGPGLLAINDGPFQLADRDGLMRMGLGSGAADPDRIGRFGLGMKAAFHVCEGFFFLEHSNDPTLREFCTPWHPKYYRNWEIEDDDPDWAAVHQAVVGLTEEWPRWFCVWIPLRRHDHLDVGIDSIRRGVSSFPGDQADRCPESLSAVFQELAPRPSELLVFLDRLMEFAFDDGNGTLSFSREEKGKISPATHFFKVDVPDKPQVSATWQAKPAWPKVFGVGERHERINVPDKARWAGGVAISLNDDAPESPHLRVFWSVFLPVGNAPCVSVPLQGGAKDVHIFVHGYFFLNDSRTAVLGTENAFADADETTELGIRVAWNRALSTSENGVLHQLIPCLEEAQAAGTWSGNEISYAIEALEASAWYASYRTWITASLGFGRVHLAGEGWRWASVAAKEALLVVPRSPDPERDTEALISRLLERSPSTPVRIEGSPGLFPYTAAQPWSGRELDTWVMAIWPRKRAFTEDQKHYLRAQLASASVVPSCSDTWKALPIYEVEDARTRKLLTVDATWIEAAASSSTLFKPEDRDKAERLLDACPNVNVWLAQSSMPAGTLPSELNALAASSILLSQDSLSASDRRIGLLPVLLPSAERSEVRLAIRYLLHGSWPHSENDEALLLFHCEQWSSILSRLTQLLGTGWAWIDSQFQPLINSAQRTALHCFEGNCDAFRSLCEEAIANPEIDISTATLHLDHDFLLRELDEGDRDHRLLARLPIHKIDDDHFTAIEDDVWLEPEEEPVKVNQELWRALRKSARIVKRASNPMVRTAQSILFSDRTLDRDGVIRLAATREAPSDYCELILECLARRTPSQASADALRQASWLPLKTGGTCRMSGIVWLGESNSHVTAFLRQLDENERLFSKEELAIDFSDDSDERRYRRIAWRTMTNAASPLLSAGDELVERLREPVKKVPALHLGISASDAGEAEERLQALEGVSHACLPSLGLVRELWSSGAAPGSAWHRTVATLFFIPWDLNACAKYDAIFQELRALSQDAGREHRERLARCFDRYLEHAKEIGYWQVLRKREDLELLNAAGEWKPVRFLTHSDTGIDNSVRLRPSTARALGFERTPKPLDLRTTEVLEEAEGNEEVMNFLRDYADCLGESLSMNQWGLFLSLLGPNARDLADEVTEGRTDSIRVNLAGPDRSPQRLRLVRCNYVLELVKDETVEVESLSGATFNAPLSRETTSFLVPKFGDGAKGARYFDHYDQQQHGEWIRCAFRDPELLRHLGPAEISACLEQTIRIHQREVLGVEPAQANAVSGMLQVASRFEQLGVRMAQQEMLGSGRMQLTQLGFRARTGTRLAEAIKLLDDADQFKAKAREERALGFGDAGYSERESTTREEEGLKLLRLCFEDDEGLHEELARAMSNRIEQEQYRAESVAFELFQNADDAYLEINAEDGIFCADFSDSRFRFAHWGRTINEPASDDPEVTRSQKRDLVKMLILHGSDKGGVADSREQTGKFGLGFKSVFLLTDEPLVLSRELAVWIRCGFFPMKLDRERRAEMADWLVQVRPDLPGGTLVQLPLRPWPDHGASHRFCALAGYLPIFARRIREIRITGNLSPAVTTRWCPVETFIPSGNPSWRVDIGRIQVEGGERMVIAIVQGEISWLFGYAEGGLQPLPEIPCIWITAPTMEASDLGFAVNAPFEPDPGRTRLSSSNMGDSRNIALLSRAADLLSQFLVWSIDTSPQFDGRDLDRGRFWTSIWRLFSKFRQDEEVQSARSRLLAAIWRRDSGYGKVLLEHAILPNELADDADGLTSLRSLRFQTAHYLDADRGRAFLREVLSWSSLWANQPQLRVLSTEVVTSRVASTLQKRLPEFEALPPLTINGLINRLQVALLVVSPETAKRLGAHLSRAVLFPDDQHSHGYVWRESERKELLEALEKMKFRSSSGAAQEPKQLLVLHADGHEKLRAELAPPDRILDPEYSESNEALAFFRLCRWEMAVAAQELAEWLTEKVQTGQSGAILSALNWLASDDPMLSESVGKLETDLETDLLSSTEFWGLPNELQNRIKLAFQRSRIDRARSEGRDWQEERHRPLVDSFDDDGDELESIDVDSIIELWDPDGAILEFTTAGPLGGLVYPGCTGDEDLRNALLDPTSAEGSACWFRLLCLGCSFSTLLGTSPRAQVIQLWTNRLTDEFWHATTGPEAGRPDHDPFGSELKELFHRVIHQTFSDENARGEGAEFWRRVFYDFRKMHHFVYRNHLPATLLEYVEYPQVDGAGLAQFLRTGMINVEIRDPGQPRFQGVIGQSMSSPLLFVFRELARLEILPERCHEACYYMNRPARRVASRLGWISSDWLERYSFADLLKQSQDTHREMLEYEEFNGYFDLPLQWFAIKK